MQTAIHCSTWFSPKEYPQSVLRLPHKATSYRLSGFSLINIHTVHSERGSEQEKKQFSFSGFIFLTVFRLTDWNNFLKQHLYTRTCAVLWIWTSWYAAWVWGRIKRRNLCNNIVCEHQSCSVQCFRCRELPTSCKFTDHYLWWAWAFLHVQLFINSIHRYLLIFWLAVQDSRATYCKIFTYLFLLSLTIRDEMNHL